MIIVYHVASKKKSMYNPISKQAWIILVRKVRKRLNPSTKYNPRLGKWEMSDLTLSWSSKSNSKCSYIVSCFGAAMLRCFRLEMLMATAWIPLLTCKHVGRHLGSRDATTKNHPVDCMGERKGNVNGWTFWKMAIANHWNSQLNKPPDLAAASALVLLLSGEFQKLRSSWTWHRRDMVHVSTVPQWIVPPVSPNDLCTVQRLQLVQLQWHISPCAPLPKT